LKAHGVELEYGPEDLERVIVRHFGN
jgi:hypothetical protein